MGKLTKAQRADVWEERARVLVVIAGIYPGDPDGAIMRDARKCLRYAAEARRALTEKSNGNG
jgi:hypothetical protein